MTGKLHLQQQKWPRSRSAPDLEAFQATGLAKYGIDPLIIAATIRNEIVFREHADNMQDEMVQNIPGVAVWLDKSQDW